MIHRKAYNGFFLGMFVFSLVVGLILSQRRVIAQVSDDPDAALQILAQLNQWRLELGLWPLKPNETLHLLALDQATYLNSLPEIQGGNEMHLDANGQGVRDRAATYNWPSYGVGGLTAVAEVGWVGNLEHGIEFWKGSDIHTETITNPGFREVGIAAVPHPWGHVYIVVLGSRPDVLPALTDASGSVLYLTQDVFMFGLGNVPIMHVRLFDEAGRPLNNGQPIEWASVIAIPAGVVGKVYVVYDDGISQSLAEVDLVNDRAVVPGAVPLPSI